LFFFVVFSSPEVLFAVNKSEINGAFKKILQDFFPRYLKILSEHEYKAEIEELRVEGHTSKTWKNALTQKELYLKNMQLSQNRAYRVLSFCYGLDDSIIDENREWLEKYFRENGMAFAKLQEHNNSRRVEFKVELKSESRVYEILE